MAAKETVFKQAEGKGSDRCPVYTDQYNNEHSACEEDLRDYLRVQVLGRIADLFLIVGQDECEVLEPVGSTFRLLISDAYKKLERVFDLLEEKIGTLTIHSLSKGYPWVEDSLPLGVFLEPVKQADQEEKEGAAA